MRRVHFVNRIDFKNCGDFACGLPAYIPFKGLKVIHHDIDDVAWNFIQRSDAVIVGASGMLNATESFNRNIIRLLDSCDTCIGYGIGFNKSPDQEIQTDILPHLKRFKLLGIRDYNNPYGIRYLPCPSVRYLVGLEKVPPRRGVGIIHHRNYRLPLGGDSIDNSRSLWEVLEYIFSSETIITSSYHSAYWGQLLGKKVVVDNLFSEKFNYFRHKPTIGVNNISSASAAPKEFMQETLQLNHDFYLEACEVLEVAPSSGDPEEEIESRLANLSWRVRSLEARAE